MSVTYLPAKADPHLLDDLGPLYHSYRLFGVENQQIENFRVNQRCKESLILGYILVAMGKVRATCDYQPSFAELFCADGYFTMCAAYFGANPAVGIDNNRDGWSPNGPEIARRLGLNNVSFQWGDVNEIDGENLYDVVANIGGLYHVSNPVDVLRKSYALARRFLVVQSVVTTTTNDANYFVSPAPGLQHGCRYSAQSFANMVVAQGYRIIDAQFNQLEGNQRPEDRGSVYMLIEKT